MANQFEKHKSEKMVKLIHKLHITGKLTVETGLHIGGTEVELDIGGLDNEVIKIKQGDKRVPYIPGSSLKGKLRALLGRYFGSSEPKFDEGQVAQLFGISPNEKNATRSLLIVRDSYSIGELTTEDKAENTITRLTGKANPRHMERIVKGAEFEIDMILDIYESSNTDKLLQTLDLAFQLLKRDYLGGSGTRGNGKVEISELKARKLVFSKEGKVTPTAYIHKFEANKKTDEDSKDSAPTA